MPGGGKHGAARPFGSGAPELEHARTRQRAALLISLIGIAASLLSIGFDEPTVALGNGVVALILVLNIGFVIGRGHTTLGSLIGLATAAGFVLWEAPGAGIRVYFWMHMLPPIAFVLLGQHLGTVAVSTIALLLTSQLLLTSEGPGGTLITLDVLLSFVAVALVSYVAERTRLRYQAALEHASLTDVLTGLGNRRAAELALVREAALARRGAPAPSVVLFDVDGFKAINDTHGHAVGDEVLRELADILREGSRLTDHVARWGGEELICVLPSTTLESARVFADRICVRVREHTFRGAGRVTISAGIAELAAQHAPHLDPTADWLACADAALYRAKQEGRDRVVLGTPGMLSTAQ